MTHKLLLADDSVTIQRVIELTFADEDVEVTTVGDGQMAIDRLDIDPPDIILADVDMPKRDGYEVAAYVKSRPKLAHIPVVLLTGAFEPIDQARAAAAGSTDVLSKPFEPQMVINRVKELLGKKRQEGADQYDAPLQMGPEQPPSLASKPTPAGRQAPPEGGQPVSLDDYFDQLDAAFSTLQPGASPAQEAQDEMDWAAAPIAPVAPIAVAPPRPVAAAPPPPPPPPPAARPEPMIAPPPMDPPVVEKKWAAPPLVPPPPRTPVAPVASAVAPVGAMADKPVAPVSVAPKATANPFANLSAAKAEAVVRPAAPVITDEIIEEVVARVLQRLSDDVVRETVTAIVSKTAERLVQEEINRIKDPGTGE